MKLSFNTLFLFFGIISLGILQSCSDDNDDPNPTPTAPNTLTFSHIDNVEFKMWTDGAEVNTEGLSIEDYMKPDYYSAVSEENYQLRPGITFKGDSIFSEEDGVIMGFPYHISNDSIYWTLTFDIDGMEQPITFDQFIGIGNANALYLPQSYYRVAEHTGTSNTRYAILDYGYYSFDYVMEENGIFESLNDIQENDTIIIYNQRAHYN